MTILLIEDNRMFGEMMEEALSGAKVHIAPSLAAAKEWLDEFRADLILVDLGLPDSRGFDTLKELSYISTPKIVLTASDESPCEAAKMGAIDFIRKTAHPYDMAARIQFHTSRLSKRARFKPEIFEEIKACIGACHLVHV